MSKRLLPCPSCGQQPDSYDEASDSYFCSPCNVWTEPKCGCPPEGCEFASHDRPDKPLDDSGQDGAGQDEAASVKEIETVTFKMIVDSDGDYAVFLHDYRKGFITMSAFGNTPAEALRQMAVVLELTGDVEREAGGDLWQSLLKAERICYGRN